MNVWYVVYSKPKQERVALENLKQQGYDVYLPLMRNRRRQRGRYITLIEPMFPPYPSKAIIGLLYVRPGA
jgi:transcriptional antiterminator RfaH